MNVILLVTFVVLSLFYGVQGEAQCIKESGANSCGCQLKDSANNTVINISLDFVHKKTLRHELYQYTYSPCVNSDCGNGKAAVCRHLELDPFSHKSIGSVDKVAYKVNNSTHVNVSATYEGPDGKSIVYLVCNNNINDDGVFTFVHHDREQKIYYFQLSYSKFCISPNPSTTSKSMTTTSTSTANAVTTMTVHTTLTTTGTNTPTVSTSVPSITTGVVTTAMSSVAPTSTSSPSNKDDRDTVLVVVLSIVGAMVVGVTVAIIIAYVRKKKQAQYESLPTL